MQMHCQIEFSFPPIVGALFALWARAGVDRCVVDLNTSEVA